MPSAELCQCTDVVVWVCVIQTDSCTGLLSHLCVHAETFLHVKSIMQICCYQQFDKGLCCCTVSQGTVHCVPALAWLVAIALQSTDGSVSILRAVTSFDGPM